MRVNFSKYLGAASLLSLGLSLHGDVFKLPAACKFPAALVKTDGFPTCGNNGSGKGGAAVKGKPKIAEDNAKNNFCSGADKPVAVTFKDLRDMQNASPDPKSITEDRTGLRSFFAHASAKIGEGTVVHLAAFVHDAHISDCGSTSHGEEVNCERLGLNANDFHIPLMAVPITDPASKTMCNSVTAEMSPHFRPDAWNQIDIKTPVTNPVRVTGPLFYDNSHTPCKVDDSGNVLKTSSPQRVSLWEVHPVYQFEVCSKTTLKDCDANNDGVWTPYSTWIATHAAATKATGTSERDQCVKAAETDSTKQ